MGTASLIVLLLAGASVAILPDHWMPIALVARAQRWSMGRTTRVALWTGVGHVLGSIALGAVVIALGYGLKGILRLEGPIVGIVLVLTGVGLFLWSLRHPGHMHPHGAEPDHADTHGHSPHHTHDHPNYNHEHVHSRGHHRDTSRSRGAWLIPAGIAASPDPTILPVFLAAIAVSTRTAIEVLAVYSLVTIVAIVGLSLAAVWGGYQVRWDWLEHHANHVTSAVLVALGIAAWVAF
ncbi:hypothetical protein [Sulfobacillus harzensis]|uniref:Urease accessory protein UreH-like transmembrane domain-containing protein n=1 Tax=Sulfobacillus harzensis TaxID=2729629 RepID=A0A7Y0L6M1_9FIRM|nr:hypothetical protein [Sulfobacillus harzensis]NMP24190.1 hypothetical protein [Sulfobacillus harzensis]